MLVILTVACLVAWWRCATLLPVVVAVISASPAWWGCAIPPGFRWWVGWGAWFLALILLHQHAHAGRRVGGRTWSLAAALGCGLSVPMTWWGLSWLGLFWLCVAGSMAWLLFRAAASRPGRPPAGLLSLINTVCGHCMFVLVCLSSGTGLLLLILPRSIRRRILSWCAALAVRLVIRAAPSTRLVLRWRPDLLQAGRILVANHQGMLDILCLLALPGRQTLIGKSWVLRTPVLGWAARMLGVINIDRLEGDGLRAQAPQLLDGWDRLLVFPEGHRSPDGGIHRFHQGAFALAAGLDGRVVPAVIAGSRVALALGQGWIHPGCIAITVLPASVRNPDEAINRWASRTAEELRLDYDTLIRNCLSCFWSYWRWRQWAIGQTWSVRQAVLKGLASGAWRLVVRYAPLTGRRWLMIGHHPWLPVVLRDLDPAARITLIARHQQEADQATGLWQEPGDRIQVGGPIDTENAGVLVAGSVDPAWLAGVTCLFQPADADPPGPAWILNGSAGGWAVHQLCV